MPKDAGYDDFCDNCNKPIKLFFKPDKSRPVYCKECNLVLLEKQWQSTITFLKVKLNEFKARGTIDYGLLELVAERLALYEKSRSYTEHISKIQKEVRKRFRKEIIKLRLMKMETSILTKMSVFLEKMENRFGIK